MEINKLPSCSTLSDNDLLILWSESLSGTVSIKLGDLKTFLGTTEIDASGSQTKSLTYTSNGDANGLFYYLGSNKGTTDWANPHVSNQITLATSASNLPLNLLVDRQTSTWYTTNAANSWIAIDIGVKRNLAINLLLLRHDNENGYYLRNFKLQGSNDVPANTVTGINTATWIDLKSWINDTSINAPNGWGAYPVSGITQGYRWFKILCNGVNSNNDNYLVLGEIELYGTLSTTA